MAPVVESLRPENAITLDFQYLQTPVAVRPQPVLSSPYQLAGFRGKTERSLDPGNTGLARQPSGATILIGLTKPSLTGICPGVFRVEEHGADG
ncbi:MAG: hypothetical protein Ct9H300mP13_5800 [Gammaproteobacteria bacterium]|nr:MAG: hypothetical protein Ct9H300mP13_5800 [Gammaproteobacteria bacterium]